MIWILLIAFSALFLLINYFRQNSAENYYNGQIESAQADLDNARTRLDNISTPIYNAIREVYGEEDATKVKNGIIRIGMPVELLLFAWGDAGDVKSSLYKTDLIERWYYDGYYNRLNNLKFKTEVTLENKRIVGWKDIN